MNGMVIMSFMALLAVLPVPSLVDRVNRTGEVTHHWGAPVLRVEVHPDLLGAVGHTFDPIFDMALNVYIIYIIQMFTF